MTPGRKTDSRPALDPAAQARAKAAKRAAVVTASARMADLDDVIGLHKAVRERLGSAIPALTRAARLCSSVPGRRPGPESTADVIRQVTRRLQFAVDAWNFEEEESAEMDASERSARDDASGAIKDALAILRQAVELQAALDRAASNGEAARVASVHRRLRVKTLGQALLGAVATASKLLGALSASSGTHRSELSAAISSAGRR